MKLRIILWLFLFSSCENVESNGLKFVFHFDHVQGVDNEVVISEGELGEIDWENQIYSLKNGTIPDSLMFNYLVCFGMCKLTTYLNEKKLYDAVLHCNVAPNSLSTKKKNVIYIKAGEPQLNVLYKNKIQLNLNEKWLNSYTKDDKRSNSSFLYNEDLRQYLLNKSMIKK